MLLPKGTCVAEDFFAARVAGLDKYIWMSMSVDAAGAGRVLFVLFPDKEGVAVALMADSPVTMTAVPVAATPPTRPLVVLLAYGAFAEEEIAVELNAPVELEAEVDSPVAKSEVDEVVTLAALAVTLVAVALLYHVENG